MNQMKIVIFSEKSRLSYIGIKYNIKHFFTIPLFTILDTSSARVTTIRVKKMSNAKLKSTHQVSTLVHGDQNINVI